MQVHEVKPIHPNKKHRRVGRGGKRGTYSGRGMKGQRSRTGHRMQPRIRELFKRYPKLRGSRRKTNSKEIFAMSLALLEKYFESGEKVNPASLAQKKIIGTIHRRASAIKILGNGTITKAVVVEGCLISKEAKKKIEAAGGSVSIVNT